MLGSPPAMSRRPTLDALAAIALWSTLALLGTRLREVPPFLLVGVALVLGSLYGVKGGFGRARPAVLALGVYGLFAYHFCLFMALRLAPPVEANLVNYLWPLLIVVMSPLLVKGTRLTAHHLTGALLGFAGAALLVTGGAVTGGGGALAGYALAALAAFIWSSYSLLTKRLGDFPTATVATFCLVSGLLSLACHALLEPRYWPGAAEWPALLLMGLGPMGGAFYLWDRAMKAGDPRTIGTLAYVTPLASTVLLALFGGGRLGPATLAAGALIVGGAALGSWR